MKTQIKNRAMAIISVFTLMILALTGCNQAANDDSSIGPNTVVMKIDGEDILADEYVSYIASTKFLVEMFGEAIDDQMKRRLTSVAEMSVESRVAVDKLCAQNGIVITQDDLDELVEQKAQSLSSSRAFYGSDESVSDEEVMKQFGYNDRTYDLYAKNQLLQSKLTAFYAAMPLEDGENQSEEYFTYTYYTSAQILKEKGSDEETEQARAYMEDLLQKIKSGEVDFMEVATSSENDDAGMVGNPNGYTFNQDNDIVTEFYNATALLGINEVSDIVETEYDFRIVKRLPLDMQYYADNKEELDKDFHENNEDNFASAKVESLIQEVIHSFNIEKTPALAQIDIDNLQSYI